jgi:Spy/CpxP family protein refolding chaperone
MKKIAMAIAALIMTSASVMAQNSNDQQSFQQQPQMDRTQMIQQNTQQMVEEYGLNEEQAQQLLQLNTEYADRIPMFFRPGQRGGQHRPDSMRMAPRGQRGPQQGAHRGGPRLARPDSLGHRGPNGGGQQADFQQMRQNMEAYNQQLQNILTAEQFARYQQNMQQRMQQRGQRGGRRGPRRN